MEINMEISMIGVNPFSRCWRESFYPVGSIIASNDLTQDLVPPSTLLNTIAIEEFHYDMAATRM
ncbi:MAG: hypothetical protein HC796_01690 [Synechococcaceae cyanobacterium RL_1_2]|nr:hypothetical protein [Synechococcaceae cyanobacterium RL_1_2]